MDITQRLSAATNGKVTLASLRHEVARVSGIAAIIVLALGLRLYGLNWDQGFDYTPHPDERAILFNVNDLRLPGLDELGLLLDADESPWNPRWFPYGSFPLYTLKGVQIVSSILPGDEVQDLRFAGRAMSAFADIITIAMVYLLGSRVYDRRTGLLAALFTSLAVIHIQLSHFFAVDTLQAMFSIVAVYFMYRVAKEGRLRDSVLAGAFVGLGLATKVSQAPIYGAFVVAHLMYLFSMNGNSSEDTPPFRERFNSIIRGGAIGVGASLAVIFIAQPYSFLDWSRFYDDVIEQSEMVRRIRDYPYTRQYADTTPYLYHIRQLTVWGLGWPLGIVAWAGLLYASLRGMRLRFGLIYLAIGWILPAAILLFSNSFIAVLFASGIALTALLATLPIRSANTRMDVLMLSWVVPLFLITGSFQVKFMRYLIPITPFLLLFGSRMIFSIWDRTSGISMSFRPWVAAGIALIIGSTAFYALSYTNLYNQTHTAVRASDWINRNAPKGSTILKEHWEEGLPNLRGYNQDELELYNDDSSDKTRRLTEQLAGADYLVFFSNRLYGTIPRLPERYPVTTQYYNLLFTNQLGYELVDVEATYPELFGVGFVDDTFDRPNVPTPEPLRDFSPSPITLNLGFADESFTVYDHPKVLIFQNVGKLDAETLRERIEGPVLPEVLNRQNAQDESIGLLLSTEDAAAQQQGGTWSDIVTPNSWTSRFPVVSWLIVIEGLALLTLPIALVVFKPLPDRGYLFSKALGILLVSLLVWLLASAKWMAFSRGSLTIAILIVSAISLIVLARNRREIVDFIKARWSILLIGEVVFLAAFFTFLMLRMANPDLWHPFRGGEKPMDFAYLNAVVKSSFMPPYDPWFGGGYINYYYWGQFIVATFIRATGIAPGIAVNLAVPMFFSLTVASAYSVVYNLAEGTRRRGEFASSNWHYQSSPRAITPSLTLPPIGGENLTPSPSMGEGWDEGETLRQNQQTANAKEPNFHWSPVIAGIAGAMFVAVLGNLDGAIQLGEGIWRAMFQNAAFGDFDFWRSSRMMPPDPPGNEITEFPFFTFLFADLHAHLMALPFTVLAIGTSLAVVLGALRDTGRKTHWDFSQIARLAILGIVVGSLRVINTWDYPTYLIVGVAAVFIAEFFAHGGIGLVMAFRAGVKSFIVVAAGFIAFLPFQLTYETFFNSVESTTNTTVLWQFLAISGLFIFIIGSFFVHESRGFLIRSLGLLANRTAWLIQAISNSDEGVAEDNPRLSPSPLLRGTTGGGAVPQISVTKALALIVGALLVGFTLTAIFSGTIGSTIPFLAALLALVLMAAFKWLSGMRADSPYLIFTAMLVAVSLSLTIGLDVFRVEGDIDRMNSIFKFYLQVWVMFALASAYLLWRIARGVRLPLIELSWPKRAWAAALVILIVSASVYPLFGTQDRLRDRFDDRVLPLTLDGEAYVQDTVYRDREGFIELDTDFEGIQWLRDNVQGSPIVLEGVTPTYRWGGRISIYTGLPTVVGWQWHQEQQRWAYRRAVGDRIRKVERIYNTTFGPEAKALLKEYGVKYIYVGQLEKLYYQDAGLLKFDTSLSGYVEKVFENEQVSIYRVLDGGF